MTGGERIAAESGMSAAGRSHVRVQLDGGPRNIETGVPVLDHLLGCLAESAGFGLALQVEPGAAEVEVDVAGSAFGEVLADPLRAARAAGFASASMVSAEALAHVALEVSEEPLLVTNVDLTDERVGGLATDLVGRFLDRLATGAGITMHVRLLNGTNTQHVLEAIFKAVGVALARACEGRA
jgi:imidazoleglycerol-phosphate dehydratase